MPGQFVYWMNVSLDLMVEGKPGEDGDGAWVHVTEPLHREFNARAKAMSLLVEGRVIYELMEASWPDARWDESLDDYLREFGQIWTSKPKVLVSRSRTAAEHNTTIFGERAIERLAALRAEAEGDVGIGGVTLATQLQRAHLIDELLLFTHPAILGHGRPLFDELDEPIMLDLLEQKEFEGGVTMHRYAVGGALPAGAALA